jgi:pimeloyl-ACP methyl ester carboxylesterase
MIRTAPHWVDKNLFPFQSRWIEIDEYHLHYLDEGEGPVILFVHGTPEWSFGYRDIIKELRKNYRCIAIDMLGFGLSDKPPGNVYRCQDHSDRLKKFITALTLKDITIVANDFGGGISLSYAIAHPENIHAVAIFNTWMWSLKGDKHFARPAKVMSSWLGKFLYLKMNFSVNVMMPAAYGDKKKLTPEIHRHYKHALPDSSSRAGAYTFAKEIVAASDWWQSLWDKMDVLGNKKFLIFWGMKDKFILPLELEKWKKKLPNATIVTFDDAGHFVQEEKPDEMIQEISRFLKN